MRKTLIVTGVLAVILATVAVGSATATEYVWSMDLDCTLCHQNEAASLLMASDDGKAEASEASGAKEGDEPENTGNDMPTAQLSAEEAERAAEISGFAALHAQGFDIACTDCHAESDGLNDGHKKLNSGKEAKRLKKSEVDDSICLTCHMVDTLGEMTADYTLLVDSNDVMVNPHDLPRNESHDMIVCTDCHSVHSGESIVQTATKECQSCHHAGVFECGTCHEA